MSQNMLNHGVGLTADRFEQLTASLTEGALVVSTGGHIFVCNPAAREKYGVRQGEHVHLPDGRRQIGEIHHFDGRRASLPPNLQVQLVQWQGQPAFLVIFNEEEAPPRPGSTPPGEERCRALMEIQLDPIFRYRPDLSITYANTAACTFFGKRREDLLGVSWLSLIPKKYQERTRRRISALLARPQMKVSEEVLLASNREQRWMQITEQPLVDSSGAVVEIQVVGRDITERKLTEQALHDSEIRYRALIEDSPALICRFLPDGTLTYVNETFCAYFGLSRQELTGRNIRTLIPLEIGESLQRALASFTPDMERQTMETRVIAAGGDTRWTRWTARAVQDGGEHALEYQAVGMDVTETRRAEEIINESEVRFREMLENLHMIAVLIKLDGSVYSANAYFYQITGYTPDQVIGKNWVQLMLPPEEQARVNRTFDRMMSTEKVIPYGENHIVTITGERRLIGWNTTRMNNSRGEMIGLASIGEDITERTWAQKMQEVVHNISQSASKVARVEELYPLIHQSLSSLMSVDNFFISLYDPQKNEISFPYFIDQYDETPEVAPAGRGLTEYVLRTGQPLLASPDVFDRLVATGEVESVGAPSVDWLGVPLKTGGKTIGVMVVQSYIEGIRFNQGDLQILDFVSTQVAMTIERKRAEQALRENEEKYHALVEVASSAIFLETLSGDILDCNSTACSMLGYTRDELLGLNVRALLSEEMNRRMEQTMDLEMELGGIHWETYNRHKNGTLIPVEVSTRLVDIGGQTLVVVYVDDISQRKQREREMEAIAGVSAALRTAITQADILPVILEQLVSRLNVHGAFIALNESDGRLVKIEQGCGTWAEMSGRLLPERENICTRVARTNRLYLNNNPRDDSLFPFPELMDGVVAVASVPLIMQGHTLGSLTVGYERSIRSDELHILTAISDIAASAIQRARLYEQTSRQAAELAEAYDATIEGWALALELRNKETEGHSRRVTELTLRLASSMGISETELVHIRRGVLLHDIGKMGIPDSILLKPGPLTEEEWTVMRLHPEHAYHMLSSISYLRPALDIPYCHHEKWNGTGYPRKLKGEEIPLYARIFAVVDVLDAITSPRPYRAYTLSNKEALAYIQEEAGQHFDPRVVQALVQIAAA